MKNYLYLALFAPSLLLAQESPISLKNQCAQAIAKHNLKAKENNTPELELPVRTLDQDSQAAVELERKKLILGPKLEIEIRKLFSESVCWSACKNVWKEECIEKEAKLELNISLRNKKFDTLIQSGADSWHKDYHGFERTLADGTHETIVGPHGCQEYDDFLKTLPDQLIENHKKKRAIYTGLLQDVVVRETDEKLSLNVIDLRIVLVDQCELDEFAEEVLNENCND